MTVPETIVCQDADAALAAFESLGRDVVVKPIFGSEGRGMMRVSDPELAWRTFRTIERTQAVLYLQRFIAHPGWDLRAFVLNGKVLAAMRRTAGDDWRTNVAQGAKAEAMQLSSEQEELALRAAAAVETIAAGVDLLPGPNGEWYVIEVNAVPGWKALAPATGVDVAKEMIAQSVRRLNLGPLPWARREGKSRVACIWEATARKAGNVHRGADFPDVTYADFLASAAAAARNLHSLIIVRSEKRCLLPFVPRVPSFTPIRIWASCFCWLRWLKLPRESNFARASAGVRTHNDRRRNRCLRSDSSRDARRTRRSEGARRSQHADRFIA